MRSPSTPRADYSSESRSPKRQDSSPSPQRNGERFYVPQGGGQYQRADMLNVGLANPEGAANGAQLGPGPVLRAEDLPIVHDLVGELLGLRETHARFKDVDDNQVLHAANCFVRYKMRSIEAIKRATRDARRYFLDDLRKVERQGFPQVAFIIELFDHLPVNLQTETAYATHRVFSKKTSSRPKSYLLGRKTKKFL